MKETRTNLINQKEALAEVIESLFSVRRSNLLTVLNVIVGIISIGWLADSFLPFLQALALQLWTGNIPPKLDLWDSFYKLSVPLGWFVLYIGVLWRYRVRKLNVLKNTTQGSFARRGLIISLSPLNEKQIKLTELEKQIDEKTLDIEHFFNHSNWGQLAFTVAHHSGLLRKCWVCTTGKSTVQFRVAEKLINYVSAHFKGRAIVCIKVEIGDENDIGLMAQKVSLIYRGLGDIESNLQPPDVVSNYTGGTSAMTGGMIIATLNQNREIEYINQKYSGKLSAELMRNIDTNLAIVTSKTNLVATEKLN